MEEQKQHQTIEDLWEKMSREDWLAGEGFSGKPGGLTKIPTVCRERIFEFAKAFSDSRAPELLEQLKQLKEENERVNNFAHDTVRVVDDLQQENKSLIKENERLSDLLETLEDIQKILEQNKSLTEQVSELKSKLAKYEGD